MTDTWRRAVANLTHGEHPIWSIVRTLSFTAFVGVVAAAQASNWDDEWWILGAAFGGKTVEEVKRKLTG